MRLRPGWGERFVEDLGLQGEERALGVERPLDLKPALLARAQMIRDDEQLCRRKPPPAVALNLALRKML